MDWSQGDYERTALTLVEASKRAIDAAKIGPTVRVLDLGSGTGNAALEAARRGAEVLAVDPAQRLLDVCRARAEQEGLAVAVKQGDASDIPAGDASVDVVVSVFGVIFAPDAERATTEMLRVVRPGGTILLTTWIPKGAIARVGRALREAMLVVDPSSALRLAPAWGDPAFVRGLFESRGASVSIEEGSLEFGAESSVAWFDEQERHHPIWLGMREALKGFPGDWERVRAKAIDALREENEDATHFRVTSPYLLINARRADAGTVLPTIDQQ